MKIQCDVCGSGGASVFCCADEAALCPSCDHRVHHANKLASKHHRLALLHPSSYKDSPLCDICQEKRGFLFCQQDRAILCRDCDVPIHNNEHTKKHNRYLLTGVKLSAAVTSLLQQPCTSYSNSKIAPAPAPTSLPIPNPTPPNPSNSSSAAKSRDSPTNSISDYLIEMLPGWHVDDLLHPFDFHHQKEDGMLPFDGNGGGSMKGFSSDVSRGGIWVPQSPCPLYFPPEASGSESLLLKDQTKDEVGGTGTGTGNGNGNGTASRKRNRTDDLGDDLFAVPQISPASSNRSRPLW